MQSFVCDGKAPCPQPSYEWAPSGLLAHACQRRLPTAPVIGKLDMGSSGRHTTPRDPVRAGTARPTTGSTLFRLSDAPDDVRDHPPPRRSSPARSAKRANSATRRSALSCYFLVELATCSSTHPTSYPTGVWEPRRAPDSWSRPCSTRKENGIAVHATAGMSRVASVCLRRKGRSPTTVRTLPLSIPRLDRQSAPRSHPLWSGCVWLHTPWEQSAVDRT